MESKKSLKIPRGNQNP